MKRIAALDGARPFHFLMAGSVFCILTFSVIGCALTHISVPRAQILDLLTAYAFICAPAAYCYWAKMRRVSESLTLIAWSFLLREVLIVPTYIAARSKMPLRDVTFAAIDHSIRLDSPAVIAATRWASTPLLWSYNAMSFMLIGAVLLTVMSQRFAETRRLILSVLIATLMAVSALALAPALGPWTIYSGHPNSLQTVISNAMLTLRSGAPYVIDMRLPTGLIFFPSFHVVLSLLSAGALWSFRWLRLPVSLLCVLIAVSTMSTGWHYATDVLGGTVLSVAASAASTWLLKTRAREEMVEHSPYVTT